MQIQTSGRVACVVGSCTTLFKNASGRPLGWRSGLGAWSAIRVGGRCDEADGDSVRSCLTTVSGPTGTGKGRGDVFRKTADARGGFQRRLEDLKGGGSGERASGGWALGG
eukprot:1035299-Rhodomonas_salina.2